MASNQQATSFWSDHQQRVQVNEGPFDDGRDESFSSCSSDDDSSSASLNHPDEWEDMEEVPPQPLTLPIERATFVDRVTQPIIQLQTTSRRVATKKTNQTSSKASKRPRLHVETTTQTPLRLWFVEPTAGSSPRLVSRPTDLCHVERGQAAIVCPPGPPAVPPRHVAHPPATTEVGWLGRQWRHVLQRLLRHGLDLVNRLRLSRILQTNLPFMTSYEALLLSQVLDVLDRPGHRTDDEVWRRAFANRNVSRILVQAVAARYDFWFHWPTAVVHNRLLDLASQIPIVGAPFAFPATENFPSTRHHAVASMLRLVLGPGRWWTRVVTGGRQGLVTDDPHHPAQNLTAESNGFESANRNQYGTYFGRMYTNRFRLAHRLPTDESLVRTFITTPIATLTNNGVVHTLRQLAKHWTNMLVHQEWGNFAHQRMEQLDPVETLRIHVPAVLLTLASLRGRNIWDADVLGPFMQRLTHLNVQDDGLETARVLVQELQHHDMVYPVCGGIPSVVEPWQQWLQMIALALDRIQTEASLVYNLVSSVELGIRLGYDIMSQQNWTVPSNAQLVQSIHDYIQDDAHAAPPDRRIASALERTTPRDKRTLMELVRHNLSHTRPAQLLLARVKTLLQREIRRDYLNQALLGLSKGEYVSSFRVDDWYWLQNGRRQRCELVVYSGEAALGKKYQFRRVTSGTLQLVSEAALRQRRWRARAYLPVAEAICRAQKALMTIELEYGKRFSLNAFMEFSSLRVALRRLVVVGQMACEVLDNARMHILGEIQRTSVRHAPAVPPQNIIVIGGGPAGMMACLHCTENCLASGGVMKLFEARDSFAKGGSTYERAQIVRLDARWIATMRYHLGTGFEDVWIPASGETDAQLGNTLPSQGFIEITIKDLENVLHVEVSRFWSKGLITVYTDSRSQFDPSTNSLTKLGENLKVGDIVLRNLDCNGLTCPEAHPWKVVELVYTRLLGVDDLKVGEVYGVYYRPEQVVLPFRLLQVDLDTKMYHFESKHTGVENLLATVHDLPSIYPAGTGINAHADVSKVVLECVEKNRWDLFTRDDLLMDAIKKEKFTLHIGDSHVIEAIGKLHDSPVHFKVTTPEPHGVCCLEGLKVSLGMHNFGETRWGAGIIDDIRSLNDRNTRIIGDFTKMVRTAPIVKLMHKIISNEYSWACHFSNLIAATGFPELNTVDPALPKVQAACVWLAENASNFRRPTLQTRFFEVGDNFYLGMQLPNEYHRWKLDLADQLVVALDRTRRGRTQLKRALAHSIDRLWYFACLETIRTGDVYNPGARRRVPQLYLINDSVPSRVGSLSVGESCRLADSDQEKYEILVQMQRSVVLRNVEGYVVLVKKSTLVTKEANLTRCPDGNQESKVVSVYSRLESAKQTIQSHVGRAKQALATFPVVHEVNHRTIRVSDKANGWVFAFIGDEQASPHFMRYSGLTGAMINAVSFNNFIEAALQGVPFISRFREYSKETNWSNGEIVQRGTGGNYGEDGFLRPGFSYSDCIDYLHSKILEYAESEQDPDDVLTRDWKAKLAASLVPRGLEVNMAFIQALRFQWRKAVLLKVIREMQSDGVVCNDDAGRVILLAHAEKGHSVDDGSNFWDELADSLQVDAIATESLKRKYFSMAKRLCIICGQILDFAAEASLYNERVTSELFNQPKPVDSVVDDFTVEAQTFATALTFAASFGAAILALRLIERPIAGIASAVLGSLSILVAFGTMTNVSRYKVRNEEARVDFKDVKLAPVKRAIFSLLSRRRQEAVPTVMNPFFVSIDEAGRQFQRDAIYYEFGEPLEFNSAFAHIQESYLTERSLKVFQRVLIHLISDKYHVNSYLQESLVEVYRATEEATFMLRRPRPSKKQSLDAEALSEQLTWFEPRLERSLQRGPVLYGFLKSRRLDHWDISLVGRYFYSFFWCCRSKRCRFAPIEADTWSILQQCRQLAATCGGRVLAREIRDVETLYWATRESDIASMIFVSAALTFLSSLVFTLAWLGSIQAVTNLAFFSGAVSTVGALLAMFHLFRKFFILVKLIVTLHQKDRTNESLRKTGWVLVRNVTVVQLFLTLTRFVTASTAAAALALSFAENGYGSAINTPATLPFWLGMGSFFTSIGSSVFFFIVDFVVRYKLPTELGPFICEIFRTEILALHDAFVGDPKSSTINAHIMHAEAWEYTAREFLRQYRFDTVFAADRFGQILQFLQCGKMEPRKDSTRSSSAQ